MGARIVKEVSEKTNDVAGDGTTTATVLAQSMIKEGVKNVAAGADPMAMKRGIDKTVKVAVEALKGISSDVNGKEDIARVASISANNQEVGDLIAEAMEKVSKDGVITIEEGDYCVRKNKNNILVGDDDIKIYRDGKFIKSIHVESRPSTFDIGGENKDVLFITARDGIYVAKIDLEENDE